MSARLIRFQQIKDKVGLSRSTIWRLQRSGRFPKSQHIGPNSVAWLEAEIDSWIKNKFAQGAGDSKSSTVKKSI